VRVLFHPLWKLAVFLSANKLRLTLFWLAFPLSLGLFIYQMVPPYVEGPPIDFGLPRPPEFHPPRYTLGDLITTLIKKRKQDLFDLEQGQFRTGFSQLNDFDQKNYLDSLKDLLGSQGWGYEMHNSVMVLYDKRLRALGEQYPLNRTISSLKLKNVSVHECFDAIARNVHARIEGEAAWPMMGSNRSVPFHRFDIDLSDITLRDALFQITVQCGCKTWNARTYTTDDKTYVFIYIL